MQPQNLPLIPLLQIIIATICSRFGHFEQKYNVTVIDCIPTGLPQPRLPRFDLMPQMIGSAFSLAIVIFSITVSMGKIFAARHKYKIDSNQVNTVQRVKNIITHNNLFPVCYVNTYTTYIQHSYCVYCVIGNVLRGDTRHYQFML